jgi:hypothetical protein
VELAIRSSSRALSGVNIGTVPLLACLVGASSILHVLAGWLRATPLYFADEYMYAELARSLAENGLPLVRGELAPFPALVYPLLTAPAWLLGDVEASWRALQLFGAVAMSLACVPVFLLARRLGLGRGLALALAALAIAVPDLVYAGWILAETLAYPLALTTVLAGAAALATPTRRGQLVFLVLAALCTGTRAQFAVLVAVYPLATVLLGLAERRLRAVLREQFLPLAVLAGGLGVGAALGPTRLLGMYRGVLDANLDRSVVLDQLTGNALVLGYASAWLLLPGAVLGFALALARPRTRLERAFATFAVTLVLGLVLEASLFGTPEHVQERYAFYVLPLLALAFGLYAARGWPLRYAHAALAAGFLCVTALAPLSGYTPGEGKTHSAFLLGFGRLEAAVGDAAGAALLAGGLAGACLLVAIAASFRPRVGTPVVLGLALALSSLVGFAATTFDLENTQRVREAQLPADRSWVDHTVDSPVTLVRTPGGSRTETLEQLFWNPSVERVALLPDAVELDAFQADRLQVAPDGALGLTGALLVETRQSWVELRGARRVATADGFALWQPTSTPRLSLLLAGRYADGWLAPTGRIGVWPAKEGMPVRGRFRIELSAPDAVDEMTFVFRGGGRSVEAVVPGGATRVVTITVCSTGPWRARFGADKAGFVGQRLVSGQASAPEFAPDPRACAPSQSPEPRL